MDKEMPGVEELASDIAEFAARARTELESIRQMHDTATQSLPMPELVHEKLNDDPLLTTRQKELFWYWEMFGITGLAYCVKQIAIYERNLETSAGINVPKRKRSRTNDSDDGYEDSPGGHSSWTKLIDDLNRMENSRCWFYLSSVPSEIMAAVIRGDLPSKMQEPAFRQQMQPYLKSDRSQGTYIVYISRVCGKDMHSAAACSRSDTGEVSDGSAEPVGNVEPDAATATSLDASEIGYGFTFAESIRVVDAVEMYIDVSNPDSEQFARLVDAQTSSPSEHLDYRRQRKYGAGSTLDDLSAHAEWVKAVNLTYLYHARQLKGTDQEAKLDQRMKRCPAYGGLSSNFVERTTTHGNSSGTDSRPLRLILAISGCLFPGIFDISESTFQLFKTVQVSDIGLDEILTCVLTCANHRDGGLNLTSPGESRGGRADLTANHFIEGLERNGRSIRDSGVQETVIRESEEKVERAHRMNALVLENDHERQALVSAVEEDLKELQELEEEAKWLQAVTEYCALEEAIEALGLEQEQESRLGASEMP